MKKNIENIFTYHRPKEEQLEKYTKIRDKAKELATLIQEECPESTETNRSIEKLEETVMIANAAIARN